MMNGMSRVSKKSTAAKQSSRRRVSARTTAPSAPAESSFHMNQKRSWPGVPNRYSTTSELMVIRPKSSATVVVVFPATPVRSSKAAPISESRSSVRRGLISLMAATMVVLPTPKPPAMRTLTACASPRSGCWARLEFANTVEYRLEKVDVGSVRGRTRWPVDKVTTVDQVADEHLDRSEQQVQMGRDLCD